MRGSSRDFYKIILPNKEEPTNEMIADLLCSLEGRLQQGYIPNTYEQILDIAIDYIREN